VIPEPRSNSLIVRAANPARLNLVRSLVARLDTPGAGGETGNVHVVYLRNAEATKLATVLRAALASLSTNTTGTGGIGGGAAGSSAAGGSAIVTSGLSGAGNATGTSAATAPITPSAQPTTGGQIQADPATNSLIITAPEPQYRQLRAVIDQLDGRRAQVMVESLLVEVNADKAAEFGIQWQDIIGNTANALVGVIGSNFTIGGTNIIDLATGAAAGTARPSNGLNVGLVRNVNGTRVLAALARFFESTGDGNVLSTPTLLTLDNEEAKIVIGQNVPFVTGQFTNTGASNGSVNPFQTIERKDVGITLRVKPQINDNGTVRLTIYQEASSVKAGTENAVNGPTTNKRTIESNVLVEDGAVVVLGGLLQDEFSGNQQKVPFLGDVPGVGPLFRTETRTRSKTNLMVFMRPVIVRDANDTDALSIDRYNLMRIKQQNAQPAPSLMLRGVDGAPIAPEINKTVPLNEKINSPFNPAPASTAPSVR
jgi:general secretion pathway protein D